MCLINLFSRRPMQKAKSEGLVLKKKKKKKKNKAETETRLEVNAAKLLAR